MKVTKTQYYALLDTGILSLEQLNKFTVEREFKLDFTLQSDFIPCFESNYKVEVEFDLAADADVFYNALINAEK